MFDIDYCFLFLIGYERLIILQSPVVTHKDSESLTFIKDYAMVDGCGLPNSDSGHLFGSRWR